MARDDKGRIRFVLVDVEANNDTLQDALRTVANALSRPQLAGAKQVKALPGGKAKHGGNGENAPPSEPESSLFDAIQEDDGEVVEEAETPRTKSTKRFVTPKVLGDVDLNSGNVPFRTFVDQKQPDDHFDRYLVVATWFKKYRDADTVTPDHVYTCYRLMDGAWPVPKDFGQPFRDMKRKGWFDNGDKRNSWKINHIGEDKVTRMGTPG